MTRYPGSPPKNKTIRAAWSALPKFISWQVWLERNRRIFQSKEQDYRLAINLVKSQLAEWLADKGDDLDLNYQDRDLGSALNFKFQKLSSSPPSIKKWQIRKNEEDFQSWLFNQPIPSLFFDGAAKGNPGIAGVGGLIINPDDTSSHRFAWGLGHSSSIQAEAMALFQGIKLLKELGLKEANVLGIPKLSSK